VDNELEDDIQEGLETRPLRQFSENESGVMVDFVELSDVMTPQYASCHTCVLNTTCSRVQLDENQRPDQVACIIEKEMLQGMLRNLHSQGVTTADEFLILPLVQSLFRMRRFYALESLEDLSAILNNPDALDMYRKRFIILNKTESQYLKIMKELLATRKEYQAKALKIIDVTEEDDIALLLTGVDDDDDKTD